MPDTNEQRDPVKEARELLARATQGPLQAERYTGRGGRISRPSTTRRNVVADIYSSDDFTLYARAPELIKTLCDEVDRLREDNSDLVAANLSNLLSEIKERLTPEEGKRFQALLMSATKGWVDEVTERTKVNRGVLEAFKGHPKRKKKYDA
ncbi:MAG TPA: hypothetical protein VFR78_12480 [Pyrinomonadaceae bacterium]|nr:hypothetical protein [Pyrinomonadaceae bacterium]